MSVLPRNKLGVATLTVTYKGEVVEYDNARFEQSDDTSFGYTFDRASGEIVIDPAENIDAASLSVWVDTRKGDEVVEIGPGVLTFSIVDPEADTFSLGELTLRDRAENGQPEAA